VGNVVSSGTGLALLRSRIGGLGLSAVLVTASRVGLAAAVAGLIAWGATTLLDPILVGALDQTSSLLGRIFSSAFEIGLVGLVFVVIYLGLAHALHVREIRDLSAMVRRRIAR
jgi:putative peptidoglycan lipid II flippase